MESAITSPVDKPEDNCNFWPDIKKAIIENPSGQPLSQSMKPECPICFESFSITTFLNQPQGTSRCLVLFCGHCICDKCFDEMYKSDEEETGEEDTDEEETDEEDTDEEDTDEEDTDEEDTDEEDPDEEDTDEEDTDEEDTDEEDTKKKDTKKQCPYCRESLACECGELCSPIEVPDSTMSPDAVVDAPLTKAELLQRDGNHKAKPLCKKCQPSKEWPDKTNNDNLSNKNSLSNQFGNLNLGRRRGRNSSTTRRRRILKFSKRVLLYRHRLPNSQRRRNTESLLAFLHLGRNVGR